MIDRLEELIQVTGAPNLYWALANLPQPFFDFRIARETEAFTLEREFPRLRTLDSAPWTIEQARSFGDELQTKMSLLTGIGGTPSSSASRPEMKDLGDHLFFATLVARAYPEAKRALLAQGRSSAEVEAMPAIQVVALHSYSLYQEARDDMFKWANLPYWMGHKGLSEAARNPRHGWANLKGGIPFVSLLPAIESVYMIPIRIQRRLNLVESIEAIRLYAASHNGSLPSSLDAITEAPVPFDPATGKPFDYKVEGSTATISAPAPPGWEGVPQFKIHYTLKLAR
jgi:hypothetical protein